MFSIIISSPHVSETVYLAMHRHGWHGCLSLVSVVYCQVDVSATGRSLVQRSPTSFGVSECDREALIMRRPWPIRGCQP
jgi:hypothetical protein